MRLLSEDAAEPQRERSRLKLDYSHQKRHGLFCTLKKCTRCLGGCIGCCGGVEKGICRQFWCGKGRWACAAADVGRPPFAMAKVNISGGAGGVPCAEGRMLRQAKSEKAVSRPCGAGCALSDGNCNGFRVRAALDGDLCRAGLYALYGDDIDLRAGDLHDR